MLKYLQSWFKPQKKITESNQPLENVLMITCGSNIKDNKVKIYFNITSTEAAKQFGEMLFLLNEGYYVQSILDIFKEISSADENYAKFIQKVISNWSEKVLELENHEDDLLNNPIVSPTYFYKSAKQ